MEKGKTREIKSTIDLLVCGFQIKSCGWFWTKRKVAVIKKKKTSLIYILESWDFNQNLVIALI